jgi:hypothetical protein
VIEIEGLAPSTLSAPDERCEPVSLDGGDYPSKPETRGRAALRWFIDSFALASCSMAGVYIGVWLDPPPTRQTEKTRPRRDSAALRPLAMMQPDGRLIESFRLSATQTAGSFTPPSSFFLENGSTERGRTTLALLDQESEDHDDGRCRGAANPRDEPAPDLAVRGAQV